QRHERLPGRRTLASHSGALPVGLRRGLSVDGNSSLEGFLMRSNISSSLCHRTLGVRAADRVGCHIGAARFGDRNTRLAWRRLSRGQVAFARSEAMRRRFLLADTAVAVVREPFWRKFSYLAFFLHQRSAFHHSR